MILYFESTFFWTFWLLLIIYLAVVEDRAMNFSNTKTNLLSLRKVILIYVIMIVFAALPVITNSYAFTLPNFQQD